MSREVCSLQQPKHSAAALRPELARKISWFIGGSERLVTRIPGLMLMRRVMPTAPCSATYEPSIIVVAQGSKRVDLGQATFIYDQSRFLLTSIELPIVSQVVEASEKEPLLALALRIEMSTVHELLSRGDIRVSDSPSASPAMVTGEVTPELLSACGRLLDLLATPEHVPFLSPLIQREIIYRLLCGPEGKRLRAVATSGEQSHSTAKAIAWIRDNYTKPVRVDDLAEMAGMGVSTLHHHFRVMTNMSPVQYQKQLRLQAARGHMLVEGKDATTAAFEVGYESVSQFNREYGRLFGRPPKRDIRTLRLPNASVEELVGQRSAAVGVGG